MNIFGFDYDGTIINIEPQKAKTFGELISHNWGVGKKEAAQFWINGGGTSRRYKFDYFYKKRFNEKLSDKTYDEIESKYSKTLKQFFYPKVKLLSHALDILRFVQSKFDFVFVSSGVPLEEIKYLVHLNGLSDYFDLVLGTSKKYPTKREHFKEILQAKKPDFWMFMGDSAEDMKLAKEYKAITIGLPTNESEINLKNAGADYVCSLKESKSVIKKLLTNYNSASEF
ncbi:hypothetical protein A2866_00275 [Candidatus Roizmanbacteria bacterium RIFCSPHIGHO2_01_FULL_39_8]|uniref:Haloacid dehalogenase n=2 Tax=Candidatus Roizmaniibacteriota TaxID=1752723 RepID=A0A1F7GPR3_9BACT|nr:MAG: hypothetical protein A2866_00275 [Candidatus Roizmanbacteria bacterium RIFCSPHIGHO2_01_FULL_39_8]OGK26033.1 MAG: hypothetical protein A3C28_02160 [Candidatus Roizmanbacteria bacterium RIFCSPHIGHO2_02_FULL_39_9]